MINLLNLKFGDVVTVFYKNPNSNAIKKIDGIYIYFLDSNEISHMILLIYCGKEDCRRIWREYINTDLNASNIVSFIDFHTIYLKEVVHIERFLNKKSIILEKNEKRRLR